MSDWKKINVTELVARINELRDDLYQSNPARQSLDDLRIEILAGEFTWVGEGSIALIEANHLIEVTKGPQQRSRDAQEAGWDLIDEDNENRSEPATDHEQLGNNQSGRELQKRSERARDEGQRLIDQDIEDRK